MHSFNSKRTVNGFTLIELVVVIGVLSILSVIGLPAFTCLIKKARATTAINQLTNISRECIIKEAFLEEEKFNDVSIQGYVIKSDELNNCGNDNDQLLVSAIPNDISVLPSFYYSHKDKQFFYAFKNKTGPNLNECISWICNENNSTNHKDSQENSSQENSSQENSSQENLSEEEKAAQCIDIDENGYFKFTNDSGVNSAPGHCGFAGLPGRIGGGGLFGVMAHRFCSAKWPCDQYGQVNLPLDKVSDFLKETDFNNLKKYSAMERKYHPDPEKRLDDGY